jgi:helicase
MPVMVSDTSLDSTDAICELVKETLSLKKQALIFVQSKRSAQKVASDLARYIQSKLALMPTGEQRALSEQLLSQLHTPTEQCKKCSHCARFGVVFHHAGLTSSQKTLIEQAFRQGIISIIVCTPTLAAGLDLPAFRSIIKDVKRFSGWGMNYIPVLEYMQMAGRAGRPGMEAYGQSILLATDKQHEQQLVDQFINGTIEDVQSKLAVEPVLRMYVLSLVASGFCRTTQELSTFFQKTLYAMQYGDFGQLWLKILRVIRILESCGFIELTGSSKATTTTMDFLSAHQLARQSAFAFVDSKHIFVTPIGVRVSQLMIDPLSAQAILKLLEAKHLTEFGVIHTLTQTVELRPLLTIKKSEDERYNLYLLEHESELPFGVPKIYDSVYEDFFAGSKTTAFFFAWASEIQEHQLFEQFDVRPGEITGKLDQLDWLLYCCEELAKLTGCKFPFARLRTRLIEGVKEELLPLLHFKGVGRIRARALYSAQFHSVHDIKIGDFHRLQSVLGDSLAESVRKQAGGIIPVQNTQQTLGEFK